MYFYPSFFYIFLELSISHSEESHNFWLSPLNKRKIGNLQSSCNNANPPANSLLMLLYNSINYFTAVFIGSVFLLQESFNSSTTT